MTDDGMMAVAERTFGRLSLKKYGSSHIFDHLKITSKCKPNKVCFELDVRPEFLNPFNQVQSGILTTVTDVVTYTAASVIVEKLKGVSLELSVRCLKDIKPGEKIFIEAEATRTGPRLVDGKAEFRDAEGILLAWANHILYMLPTSGLPRAKEALHVNDKVKPKL